MRCRFLLFRPEGLVVLHLDTRKRSSEISQRHGEDSIDRLVTGIGTGPFRLEVIPPRVPDRDVIGRGVPSDDRHAVRMSDAMRQSDFLVTGGSQNHKTPFLERAGVRVLRTRSCCGFSGVIWTLSEFRPRMS